MNEMSKEELMQYILNLEWEMFTNVQNTNGRAQCQDDRKTFTVMRLSQLNVWDKEILASYFLDLLEAKEAGRNLMTEKYAYMMEYTYPEEYGRIKDLLPTVTDKAKEIAKAIVEIYSVWEREMSIRYPKLRSRGRVQQSNAAMDGSVSAQDYQYCELLTYSERTLQLLLEYIGQKAAQNLYMEEIRNMVRSYGYKDLDEAEKSLTHASRTEDAV